jgi:polar amino acid transport system substrate-binding protein
MASDQCWEIEMKRALERQKEEKTLVIPVLLRPVLYKTDYLKPLRVLPSNGKPVTRWPDRDEAFENIAKNIRSLVDEFEKTQRVSWKHLGVGVTFAAAMSAFVTGSTANPPPVAPSTPPFPSSTSGHETLVSHSPITSQVQPHTSSKGLIANQGLITPGVLSWGADPSNGAPYVFRDADGSLRGFEVDIAHAIARLMGVTQHCYPTSYKWTLRNNLQARKMDIILNRWEITASRVQNETFSVPYYRCDQQLVVRTDDSRFSRYAASSLISLIDFKNYTFGTGSDYKSADLLRAAGSHVITSNQPLSALKHGVVDIVMIDAPVVAYSVQGKGKGAIPDNTLRPIGKLLYTNNNYVIGLKKNDPHADILRLEINQALSILKRDGTLKHIYMRWGLWNEFQADIDIINYL